MRMAESLSDALPDLVLLVRGDGVLLRLRSLARLDVARELREAIANREIRLRYIGRHDLVTGRLAAQVGYLRWIHPLRGECYRSPCREASSPAGS
jgi:hypothetical protein